ncbi:MAG: hypothetical protein M1814_001056 [Vezdaea aestivalis]|nr:MAG: hypothetical protein M1814_001056 [Vezdaea aestivalis]
MSAFDLALLTAALAAQSSHDAATTFSSPEPRPTRPVFQAQRYHFDNGFFGEKPPNSNREYKAFYRRHLGSDMSRNPQATLQELTDNGLRQVPDVLSRRRATLRQSNTTDFMELGSGALSAVGAKSFAPTVVSRYAGERYNASRFGLKDKHRDADFQTAMHKASGTDTDTVLNKGNRYARKKVIVPVKKQGQQELLDIAKDQALDLYGSAYAAFPHATNVATELVLDNADHVAGMGQPMIHGGIALKKGYDGAVGTSKKLDKQRKICEKRAQQPDAHPKMIKKIASKLYWSKKKT